MGQGRALDTLHPPTAGGSKPTGPAPGRLASREEGALRRPGLGYGGQGPGPLAGRGCWELTAEQVWYPEPKSKRHCSSME